MADRITITATAGQDDTQQVSLQALVVTFEAALAVLVADGASPTQAHVTAADAAYTLVKAHWTKDFIIDYDRLAITNQNLQRQAMRAMQAVMNSIR